MISIAAQINSIYSFQPFGINHLALYWLTGMFWAMLIGPGLIGLAYMLMRDRSEKQIVVHERRRHKDERAA